MSEYGFEIQNSSGKVIADANYPVYKVISTGAMTLGGNTAYQYTDISFAPIPLTQMPLVLFAPSGAGPKLLLPQPDYYYPYFNNISLPAVSPWCYLLSPDQSAIIGARFHGYYGTMAPWEGETFTSNYVVAVPVSVSNIPSSTYGVVVYDKDGKKTFDSGERLLTIKLIRTITSVPESGLTIDHPIVTGTKYVALTSAGSWLEKPATTVFRIAYPGCMAVLGVTGSGQAATSIVWNPCVFSGSVGLDARYDGKMTLVVAEWGA